MLRRDDARRRRAAYRARVATIDHRAADSLAIDHRAAGQTADPWAGTMGRLFAPARGLRPLPVDTVIAATVAVVQIVGTIEYGREEPSPWSFDGGAYALLGVGAAALLFRRRWPEATVIVTAVAAAGYAATGYPRGPAGYPAFVVALVTAIMMGRRWIAWSVMVAAYAAFVWLPFVNPDEIEAARTVAGAAMNLSWLPLVCAASEIARIRLDRLAVQARALHEEARRRASDERLLIARELHDVLAHTISLINVQSGVALHLLDERPEQARPALAAINQASDEALGELRSVLDVLHGGLEQDRADGSTATGGASGSRAPRAPTAGLRDIDDLVRRTRVAGHDVRVAVDGPARPVPPEVDLAAYRIVQEGLTNVVRHAGGGCRTTVGLVYEPAALVVRVDDDGRGGAGPWGSAGVSAGDGHDGARPGGAGRGGRGIAGMRERVRALGGTFDAGPRPGRGFRVRARFPLQDGAG